MGYRSQGNEHQQFWIPRFSSTKTSCGCNRITAEHGVAKCDTNTAFPSRIRSVEVATALGAIQPVRGPGPIPRTAPSIDQSKESWSRASDVEDNGGEHARGLAGEIAQAWLGCGVTGNR
jgi:hypothetical protein